MIFSYKLSGLITSICLPVYYPKRVLKGVACVDVRMADIIGDVNYYQHGEYSYTFVIDGTGTGFTCRVLFITQFFKIIL